MMAQLHEQSLELGRHLCDIFGLVPNDTLAITLSLRGGDIAQVEIEQLIRDGRPRKPGIGRVVRDMAGTEQRALQTELQRYNLCRDE